MEKLYPYGFTMLMDNDPKHKAILVKKYMDKYFSTPQFLPPYSPDLNPIELVWAWLKQKVAQEVPNSIEKMKSSIRNHWRSITPDMIRAYVNNLKER